MAEVLRAGDTLLVGLHRTDLSVDEVVTLKRQLADRLPGIEAVVLIGGVSSMAVVRADGAGAAAPPDVDNPLHHLAPVEAAFQQRLDDVRVEYAKRELTLRRQLTQWATQLDSALLGINDDAPLRIVDYTRAAIAKWRDGIPDG